MYRKKLFYEDETTRPEKLTEMIEVVEKLAENFPFVRVDFYLIENHIIFGELTFYPGNGLIKFLPEEMNTIVGDYFKLPN